MKRLIILNSLAVFIGCLSTAQSRALDNQVEFKALCSIFRQLDAINNQSEKSILQAGRDALDRARESVRNALSRIEGKNDSIGTLEGLESVKGTQTGSGPVIPTTPFGIYVSNHARRKVNEILKQLGGGEKIAQAFQQYDGKIVGALSTAKTSVREAVCKESAKETIKDCGQGAFADSKANGAGTKAGQSLANDLAYLCATANAGNECIGASEVTITAATKNADAGATYQKLVDKCRETETVPNLKALKTALQDFFNLFGRQAKLDGSSTHGTLAVLGSFPQGGASQVCGNQHVCIDYGTRSKKNEEIPWVKEVQNVIREWDIVKEGKHNISQLLQEVKTLEADAWKEYEEAKLAENVSFEMVPSSVNGGPTRPPSSTLTSDKTAVHDPTTVNTANIPSFILPWTLLI